METNSHGEAPEERHSGNPPVQFDAGRIEALLTQAAHCTIPDQDFVELFDLCRNQCSEPSEADPAALDQRLALAVNSYCHILRIASGLKDQTVDLETASRLKACLEEGSPMTDEEIQLLGRRGETDKADHELFDAFLRLIGWINGLPNQSGVVPVQFYTLLSDEQFVLLAEGIFEQAVVHPTVNVTDKAFFARGAAESPKLEVRLHLAHHLALHNETYLLIQPQPNLTPAERKAEADCIEDLCRRAANPDSLTPAECAYIVNHRPTLLLLRYKLSAAAPMWEKNFLPIFQKFLCFRAAGGDDA